MLNKRSELVLSEVGRWYRDQRKGERVNTNVMNVGLIVSEMIRGGLPITTERLLSNGESQVRGLSGSSVARILERHGETRPFTAEGGRTSRGTLPLARSLQQIINESADSVSIGPTDLVWLATDLENFFTRCVQTDYMDKQRIKVELNASKPVSRVVEDILTAASTRSDRPTGIVMQHLVGAKLELRFPEENIGKDKAHTADQQTDRQGDFQVGTTAFHVTVSPMEKLINRCRENRNAGFRPVLLVPAGRVAAAIQLAEVGGLADVIGVESVESFVGTNIEELSIFDGERIKGGIAQLVRRYNNRIRTIETDQSLRIDEPAWVAKLAGV
ncbi:DUF4928 family protein [Kocuria rosea]|uniref:DUF4928 family protein n=1 Tax=Kocuria rosea TaxID=1275 RepID=UPI000D60EC79|nr:DUF4928 family protein [Kocuria rosea]PWD94491.1 DUF4928 domain-containing protein [Dietzia maris]PWF81816.1 DUF4928 domain-containing protein [Kocuria rosea]